MRVKPIPPPPAELDGLARAQRAVPLVPGSEADCCGRLIERLDLPSRDVARTWLTFLRGLGLVRAGDRGFVRTRAEVDRETLAAGLREGVFGAREVLAALGPEPTTPEAAFEAVEPAIPRWERAKEPNWRETWRDRVEHLLGWLALAGLVVRADDGYVRSGYG